MKLQKPALNGRYKQGYFTPTIAPEKYIGSTKLIICRSSLEFKMCIALDNDPAVERWSSENLQIPYISPIDRKSHVYYPDYYVEKRNKDGTLSKMIIEVKPASKLSRPRISQSPSTAQIRAYNMALREYITNTIKYIAGKEFCNKRGMEFRILTDKELDKITL